MAEIFQDKMNQYILYGGTHIGKIRRTNQDNFIISKSIKHKEWVNTTDNIEFKISSQNEPLGIVLFVADGMGGHLGGEIASQLACDTIINYFNQINESQIPENDDGKLNDITDIIYKAHLNILSNMNEKNYGMGTTGILVWVIEQKAYISWAGDSRAYKYNSINGLSLLTDDHNVAWEAVMAGKISPEDFNDHPQSNLLTSCLGSSTYSPRVDAKVEDLTKGDYLLLCSDGLNNMLQDAEINGIIKNNTNFSNLCNELINAALKAGGNDNITITMLKIE